MAGDWYVYRGGPQSEGPFSKEQVLAGLRHGNLPTTCAVCAVGANQ